MYKVNIRDQAMHQIFCLGKVQNITLGLLCKNEKIHCQSCEAYLSLCSNCQVFLCFVASYFLSCCILY